MSSAHMPSGPTWSSRVGFLFAAAGASIGLGNLQRFPQLVYNHGGGAFLVIYIACVCGFGVPLLAHELRLGQLSRASPSAVAGVLLGRRRTGWNAMGWLGIFAAFGILMTYSLSVSWALLYAIGGAAAGSFRTAAGDLTRVLPLCWGLLAVTWWTTRGDGVAGVERWGRRLMPGMLCLLAACVGWAASLPGWGPGITYLLSPDFARCSAEAAPLAMSQAFFSLCVGEAVMLSFGARLPAGQSCVKAAVSIALLDTAVAVLAGCILFPILFSQPAEVRDSFTTNGGFIYDVLPHLFSDNGWGSTVSTLFFLLMAFAGYTTCIALVDVCAGWLAQVAPRLTRGQAAAWVCIGVGLGAVAPAMTFVDGSLAAEAILPGTRLKGLFPVLDFLFGGVAMALSGLGATLLSGWALPATTFAQLMGPKARAPTWARIYLRWIAPIGIICVLLQMWLS